jgi:hypothetical protein
MPFSGNKVDNYSYIKQLIDEIKINYYNRMRVKFSKSDIEGKKMKAVFYDGDKKVKTTHFGSASGSSFINHKDEKIKDAWLARHKVNENWNDYMSAGSLARYILWNKETITSSIEDYKKRFKLT